MQLATERTRLHLDGIRSPITADVTKRREDGVVVTQPLPFLRLDTTVTERGRRSRIRRVAIAMDGDMPRLLLELSHDGALIDDTLPAFVAGVSERKERGDSTVPYELASRTERAEIVVGEAPPALVVAEPRSWLARFWLGVARALARLTAPASS